MQKKKEKRLNRRMEAGQQKIYILWKVGKNVYFYTWFYSHCYYIVFSHNFNYFSYILNIFFLFYFCWVAQKCAAQFFLCFMLLMLPCVWFSLFYVFFIFLSCLLSFAFAPIQTIKETYLCKYCTFSPIQKHPIHLAALFYSQHSVLVGVSFGVFPRLIIFLELSSNKF